MNHDFDVHDLNQRKELFFLRQMLTTPHLKSLHGTVYFSTHTRNKNGKLKTQTKY